MPYPVVVISVGIDTYSQAGSPIPLPVCSICYYFVNPLVTNGLSLPYQMGVSIFIFSGNRKSSSFLFYFFDENHVNKQIAPDGTLRFAASHLGLFCLPMSNKKDARLIWVNLNSFCLL